MADKFTQSLADIKAIKSKHLQSRTSVKAQGLNYFQAQVRVTRDKRKYFQAQAKIKLVPKASTQAQAWIKNKKSIIQAQAFIHSQRYLVQYNGFQLPGYLQEEIMDSTENIESMYGAYGDSEFSEYLGLENKVITLRLLVLGDTYLECKNQIQDAATALRSQRTGFKPLYVQNYSKHYEALVKSITLEADARINKKAEYTVIFEAKPWLYSDTETTISGTGTIQTSGRTLYNGTWTPTTLLLSGTNITVSGYTETGDFTGFVSISGVVTDLTINTEIYTVEMTNSNVSNIIQNEDYQIYVGPGITYFDIDGATDCEISYHDRWAL